MFANRTEAGRQLAGRLAGFAAENPAVYALPRGGIPVAAEVAVALGAPLDLIFVRKIGAPLQPELALGAVVDGAEPAVVWNEDIVRQAGVTKRQKQDLADRAIEEVRRRRQLFASGRAAVPPKGRTAIVVDDGLATGATARAAIRALRKAGARRVVLAVPVAPADAAARMRLKADVFICLEEPEAFGSVGAHYADFSQVSDEEAIAILDRQPRRGEAAGAA